ncbi:MAG: hypothetical protein ACI89X_003212 [Planctomycetota bacterium]|jgi:hypothetical protein
MRLGAVERRTDHGPKVGDFAGWHGSGPKALGPESVRTTTQTAREHLNWRFLDTPAKARAISASR